MFEQNLRWRIALGCSLVLTAAGILFVLPALLVAAMAPIVFVGYSALTGVSAIDEAVTIDRTVVPQRTYPGETVGVELTVTNSGDGSLTELRIIDGVPEELPVIEGSPRAALSLRSGESATISYTVRTRYGEFEFEPVLARTQSLSGRQIYTTELTASGASYLAATLEPDEFPLSQQTAGISGELTSERGGEGLEFHSIRSYQPEDPVSRINWRQYARERELSTVDYRQQEAAEVVVIVDARQSAGVAGTETDPTGTELSIYTANEVVAGLLANRNRVGAVTLGNGGEDGFEWVPPGTDRQQRIRIGELFDSAAETVSPDTEQGDSVEPDPLAIVERLNKDTQIILVTPLCDEYPIELIRTFKTTGYTVSVYTPDVTSQRTAGGAVATAQRTLQVAELRKLGTTIVDWDPAEPLNAALSRASETRTTTSTQP